jgi:hypothetical protein
VVSNDTNVYNVAPPLDRGEFTILLAIRTIRRRGSNKFNYVI